MSTATERWLQGWQGYRSLRIVQCDVYDREAGGTPGSGTVAGSVETLITHPPVWQSTALGMAGTGTGPATESGGTEPC